jgi:hypothetical protein
MITIGFREPGLGRMEAIGAMAGGAAMILLGLGLGYWMITMEEEPESFRERYQATRTSDDLDLNFLNQPQGASPNMAAGMAQAPVAMPQGSRPPVRGQGGVPAQPMQTLAVACPHCGSALAQNPQLRGMAVACPHCHKPFLMP